MIDAPDIITSDTSQSNISIQIKNVLLISGLIKIRSGPDIIKTKSELEMYWM